MAKVTRLQRREKLALIINHLQKLKPKAIALDYVLMPTDTNAPETIHLMNAIEFSKVPIFSVATLEDQDNISEKLSHFSSHRLADNRAYYGTPDKEEENHSTDEAVIFRYDNETFNKLQKEVPHYPLTSLSSELSLLEEPTKRDERLKKIKEFSTLNEEKDLVIKIPYFDTQKIHTSWIDDFLVNSEEQEFSRDWKNQVIFIGDDGRDLYKQGMKQSELTDLDLKWFRENSSHWKLLPGLYWHVFAYLHIQKMLKQ